LDNLLWFVNYPNPRHGSRVIPIGRDTYFTQGTRAETLYQNPQDFGRNSALGETRAEKPCHTPKDSDRAFTLKLRGGLPTGREALQPSEPRHSPDKATSSYYTKNASFATSFFLSILYLLRTWGFWWYLRRKSLLQKSLFKWHHMEWHGHDYEYTGGGRIFWNGFMHVNIGKPWLWRCGTCGYIGGGHIFRTGGMHANIFVWG
jgi:hypothetical protein